MSSTRLSLGFHTISNLRVDCSVSLYADDTLLYQPVDTIEDAVQFQHNINAIQQYSVDWKMPFNDKKCKAIASGSQNFRPTCKVGETVMDWADTTTYLGVSCSQIFNLTNIWCSKKIKLRKLC